MSRWRAYSRYEMARHRHQPHTLMACLLARCPATSDERRHDSFVERKDPPPRYLPEGLKWAYTRCGAIKVADSDYYVDDFAKGEGTHYQFDAQTIEQYVSTAKDYIGK